MKTIRKTALTNLVRKHIDKGICQNLKINL